MSGRKKTFEVFLTIFSLVVLLSGCPGAGPNEAGGAAPPGSSPTIPVTIKVRAARGAPDDYSLVPGDMIAGAKIEVSSEAAPDDTPLSAATDESGRAVVMVQSGSYRVTAQKETHDPYCWWYGSEEVEVAGRPVTVKLYDLWVLCE